MNRFGETIEKECVCAVMEEDDLKEVRNFCLSYF